MLQKRRPVLQARQSVVMGKVPDMRLRGEPVTNVPHHIHAQAFSLEHHGAGNQFNGNAFSAAVQQQALIAQFLLLAHHQGNAISLLGGHEIQYEPADQFLARIPQQLAERGVHVSHAAGPVEHDAFKRGEQEFFEPRLAVAQGGFGASVLGDVADQHKGAQHIPLGIHVRQQVHFDPLRQALCVLQHPLVAHRFAAIHHPGHLRLDERRCFRADDFADRAPDHTRGRQPERLGVAPVRIQAAIALGLEQCDQHGHVVRQQAEARRLIQRHALQFQQARRLVHAAIIAFLYTATARQRSSQARAFSSGWRSR